MIKKKETFSYVKLEKITKQLFYWIQKGDKKIGKIGSDEAINNFTLEILS